MQGEISMDLSFCQSEKFFLDELVIKLADVYERKAFAELLKMILQMVLDPSTSPWQAGCLEMLRSWSFSLGTWAGTSWDAISKQWNEQKMKFPDGSILICDGEPGLSEAFAEYASEQQRGTRFIEQDLYHVMYQDGGCKVNSKPVQEVSAGALAIELPQEDFKYVSEEEKD